MYIMFVIFSACTSASLEPSYVLRAIGADEDLAHSSIRLAVLLLFPNTRRWNAPASTYLKSWGKIDFLFIFFGNGVLWGS